MRDVAWVLGHLLAVVGLSIVLTIIVGLATGELR